MTGLPLKLMTSSVLVYLLYERVSYFFLFYLLFFHRQGKEEIYFDINLIKTLQLQNKVTRKGIRHEHVQFRHTLNGYLVRSVSLFYTILR